MQYLYLNIYISISVFKECQSKNPCIVTDNITYHGKENEDLFDSVVFKVMNFRTDHVSNLKKFDLFN